MANHSALREAGMSSQHETDMGDHRQHAVFPPSRLHDASPPDRRADTSDVRSALRKSISALFAAHDGSARIDMALPPDLRFAGQTLAVE